MNFLKNQLIPIKFERKVKLFIEVAEPKFKQLILMEMKYRIMRVQIVIQVLSNSFSLILNMDEEKEIWLWFFVFLIYNISFLCAICIINRFSFGQSSGRFIVFEQRKKKENMFDFNTVYKKKITKKSRSLFNLLFHIYYCINYSIE
jgi:hypothetical protein